MTVESSPIEFTVTREVEEAMYGTENLQFTETGYTTSTLAEKYSIKITDDGVTVKGKIKGALSFDSTNWKYIDLEDVPNDVREEIDKRLSELQLDDDE